MPDRSQPFSVMIGQLAKAHSDRVYAHARLQHFPDEEENDKIIQTSKLEIRRLEKLILSWLESDKSLVRHVGPMSRQRSIAISYEPGYLSSRYLR